HRHHFALLGLFLGGIRDDDSTLLRFLLFDPSDHDAILQWSYLHSLPPPKCLPPALDRGENEFCETSRAAPTEGYPTKGKKLCALSRIAPQLVSTRRRRVLI